MEVSERDVPTLTEVICEINACVRTRMGIKTRYSVGFEDGVREALRIVEQMRSSAIRARFTEEL